MEFCFNKGGDGLVASAREIQPILSRNAAQVDRDRRLLDENIKALEQANLWGAIVPRRWGGGGVSLRTFLQIGEELAKACPSTAWVHFISGIGSWMGAQLPDEGQRAVFANGVFRKCGVAFTGGQAIPVEGGFRVTGKWPYASGSLHAQWASVGVEVKQDDGPGWFANPIAWAPMSEVKIEDTWHVEGMRGTGSNTLVLENVFVPDHLMQRPQTLAGPNAPPRALGGEAVDMWSFKSAIVVAGAGVLIGIAQGMLDGVVAQAAERGIPFTSFKRQIDSQVFQHEVGSIALKINGARLMALHNADKVDGAALDRRPLEYPERARIRGEITYVADLTRAAVDSLMTLAGSSAFAVTNRLQRHWRDGHMACRHGFHLPGPGAEIYGRALLGVEPNISPEI